MSETRDDSPGGSWVTYDELARRRGITRLSAERMVQRKGWRRQRGNDKTARVLVPEDELPPDIPPLETDKPSLWPAVLQEIREAHAHELIAVRGELSAVRGELASVCRELDQAHHDTAEQAARVQRLLRECERLDDDAHVWAKRWNQLWTEACRRRDRPLWERLVAAWRNEPPSDAANEPVSVRSSMVEREKSSS